MEPLFCFLREVIRVHFCPDQTVYPTAPPRVLPTRPWHRGGRGLIFVPLTERDAKIPPFCWCEITGKKWAQASGEKMREIMERDGFSEDRIAQVRSPSGPCQFTAIFTTQRKPRTQPSSSISTFFSFLSQIKYFLADKTPQEKQCIIKKGRF